MASKLASRVFKTGRFSKDAKKAGIDDAGLCAAMREVMAGQADDLGGGVFKKRLNDNRHRSIILAKGYANLTKPQVKQLIAAGQFVEICHDPQA